MSQFVGLHSKKTKKFMNWNRILLYFSVILPVSIAYYLGLGFLLKLVFSVLGGILALIELFVFEKIYTLDKEKRSVYRSEIALVTLFSGLALPLFIAELGVFIGVIIFALITIIIFLRL